MKLFNHIFCGKIRHLRLYFVTEMHLRMKQYGNAQHLSLIAK